MRSPAPEPQTDPRIERSDRSVGVARRHALKGQVPKSNVTSRTKRRYSVLRPVSHTALGRRGQTSIRREQRKRRKEIRGIARPWSAHPPRVVISTMTPVGRPFARGPAHAGSREARVPLWRGGGEGALPESLQSDGQAIPSKPASTSLSHPVDLRMLAQAGAGVKR